MSTQSEIDEALGRLGSAEPPPGLEKRIQMRLQIPQRRFPLSMTRTLSACALAASIALSAVALSPSLRSLVFHRHSELQNSPAVTAPRVASPATGGFGTASAVHVPAEPVPVQPTPVNQGRGRSRPGRAVLPNGNVAPLPRGVAAPHVPPSVATGSAH
ncbi:MAG TPA: hypothetical protein VMB49_02080 [Acidobacteriaceae bacterium]|nr:hypothetical protein [Acidobacteriaceae bacterium]